MTNTDQQLATTEQRSTTPDPREVANDAGNVVHLHLQVAELIRCTGDEFLAIAQTAKAAGDALALDIERRVEQFGAFIDLGKQYALQQHELYAGELKRLAEMSIPQVARPRAALAEDTEALNRAREHLD